MRTSHNTIAIILLTAGIIAFQTGCQAQQDQKKSGQGKDAELPVTDSPVGSQKAAGTLGDIKPAEAEKMIANEPLLQILDVRTPEEVAGGTIAGAKTININDRDFEARVQNELDKDKPVLVYCLAGGRSSRASKMMQGYGFGTVYNLSGGFSQWQAEGRAVKK